MNQKVNKTKPNENVVIKDTLSFAHVDAESGSGENMATQCGLQADRMPVSKNTHEP